MPAQRERLVHLLLQSANLGFELLDAPLDVLERAKLPVNEPAHRLGHLGVDLGAMDPECLSPACLPRGSTTLNSYSSPRNALIVALRTLTQAQQRV